MSLRFFDSFYRYGYIDDGFNFCGVEFSGVNVQNYIESLCDLGTGQMYYVSSDASHIRPLSRSESRSDLERKYVLTASKVAKVALYLSFTIPLAFLKIGSHPRFVAAFQGSRVLSHLLPGTLFSRILKVFTACLGFLPFIAIASREILRHRYINGNHDLFIGQELARFFPASQRPAVQPQGGQPPQPSAPGVPPAESSLPLVPVASPAAIVAAKAAPQPAKVSASVTRENITRTRRQCLQSGSGR